MSVASFAGAPPGVSAPGAPSPPDPGEPFARITSTNLGSSELKPTEKVALLAVDYHCFLDRERLGGDRTDATDEDMAKSCGLPISTFQRCMKALRLKERVASIGRTCCRVIVRLCRYLGPRTPLTGEGNSPHSRGQLPSPVRGDSICRETESTTDDVGSSSSCPAPPVETPEEPWVAAALAPLPTDAARDAIRPAIPGWLAAGFRRDWIAEAVAEVAGRMRADIVHSPGKLAAKILGNWRREGRITRRFGPRALPPPEPKPADPVPVAESPRAEQLRQAEDDELRARWESLPEPERESIRVAVRAENPGIARWANLIEPLCMARLKAERCPDDLELGTLKDLVHAESRLMRSLARSTCRRVGRPDVLGPRRGKEPAGSPLAGLPAGSQSPRRPPGQSLPRVEPGDRLQPS